MDNMLYLSDPVEQELFVDYIFAVFNEKLLDGAAKRLHIGAKVPGRLHKVRVHVGRQHVSGAEVPHNSLVR